MCRMCHAYKCICLNVQMRVLLAVSALLWSCLVGRLIAFGPTVQGWCWCPRLDADSWYRLTDIPCRVPHTGLRFVPWFLITCTIPALFLRQRTLHALIVMAHTSEQAFFPIFIAQIHNATALAVWAFLNATCQVITIVWSYSSPVGPALSLGIWFKCFMDLWFTYIQLWIRHREIVREPPDYDGRSARVMTV